MADRGRKAFPSSNSYLTNRWYKEDYELHLKKLGKSQRVIDNVQSEPASNAHLESRLKQNYTRNKRQEGIDVENVRLFSRLNQIAGANPSATTSCFGGRNNELHNFRSTLQIKPGIRLNANQVPQIDCHNEAYAKRSRKFDHIMAARAGTEAWPEEEELLDGTKLADPGRSKTLRPTLSSAYRPNSARMRTLPRPQRPNSSPSMSMLRWPSARNVSRAFSDLGDPPPPSSMRPSASNGVAPSNTYQDELNQLDIREVEDDQGLDASKPVSRLGSRLPAQSRPYSSASLDMRPYMERHRTFDIQVPGPVSLYNPVRLRRPPSANAATSAKSPRAWSSTPQDNDRDNNGGLVSPKQQTGAFVSGGREGGAELVGDVKLRPLSPPPKPLEIKRRPWTARAAATQERSEVLPAAAYDFALCEDVGTYLAKARSGAPVVEPELEYYRAAEVPANAPEPSTSGRSTSKKAASFKPSTASSKQPSQTVDPSVKQSSEGSRIAEQKPRTSPPVENSFVQGPQDPSESVEQGPSEPSKAPQAGTKPQPSSPTVMGSMSPRSKKAPGSGSSEHSSAGSSSPTSSSTPTTRAQSVQTVPLPATVESAPEQSKPKSTPSQTTKSSTRSPASKASSAKQLKAAASSKTTPSSKESESLLSARVLTDDGSQPKAADVPKAGSSDESVSWLSESALVDDDDNTSKVQDKPRQIAAEMEGLPKASGKSPDFAGTSDKESTPSFTIASSEPGSGINLPKTAGEQDGAEPSKGAPSDDISVSFSVATSTGPPEPGSGLEPPKTAGAEKGAGTDKGAPLDEAGGQDGAESSKGTPTDDASVSFSVTTPTGPLEPGSGLKPPETAGAEEEAGTDKGATSEDPSVSFSLTTPTGSVTFQPSTAVAETPMLKQTTPPSEKSTPTASVSGMSMPSLDLVTPSMGGRAVGEAISQPPSEYGQPAVSEPDLDLSMSSEHVRGGMTSEPTTPKLGSPKANSAGWTDDDAAFTTHTLGLITPTLTPEALQHMSREQVWAAIPLESALKTVSLLGQTRPPRHVWYAAAGCCQQLAVMLAKTGDSSHLARLRSALRTLLQQRSFPEGETLTSEPALALRASLAFAYRETDCLSQAQQAYEELIEDMSRARGPLHEDTIAMAVALGDVLIDRDDVLKAKELFERNLALLEGAQPPVAPADPRCLLLKQRLADVLMFTERAAEAEVYYREVLEQRYLSLGEQAEPDVPTLLTALDLAACLLELGQNEDAQEVYEGTVELLQEALGAADLHVLQACNGYAQSLAAQSKYGEAVDLLEGVRTKLIAAVGPNHADVAAVSTNLGLAHAALGQFTAATLFLKEALEIRLRNARSRDDGRAEMATDSSVVTALNNIAFCMMDEGRSVEAHKYFEDALGASRALQGERGDGTVRAKHNLATCLRACNLPQAAQGWMEEVVALVEQRLGPKHADLAAALTDLALLYEGEASEKKALPLFTRALEIRKSALGDSNPATLQSVYYLADSLMTQAQYAEAEPLLAELHSKLAASLAAADPKIQQAAEMLASCRAKLQEQLEAKEKPSAVESVKEAAEDESRELVVVNSTSKFPVPNAKRGKANYIPSISEIEVAT